MFYQSCSKHKAYLYPQFHVSVDSQLRPSQTYFTCVLRCIHIHIPRSLSPASPLLVPLCGNLIMPISCIAALLAGYRVTVSDVVDCVNAPCINVKFRDYPYRRQGEKHLNKIYRFDPERSKYPEEAHMTWYVLLLPRNTSNIVPRTSPKLMGCARAS